MKLRGSKSFTTDKNEMVFIGLIRPKNEKNVFNLFKEDHADFIPVNDNKTVSSDEIFTMKTQMSKSKILVTMQNELLNLTDIPKSL